jgi:P4 family phage/plasmid primase-like protien
MTGVDPFADLAGDRWIWWREEKRGPKGKATKVPYSPKPKGGPGKSDDPATWGDRAAAQECARRRLNGSAGGTGIMLGALDADRYLAGIDLDSCLDDGMPSDWAAEILGVVRSYCEVSPSGAGLKLYLYLLAADVRPFLDAIGVQPAQWGTRRSVGPNSADHGPAIEIYCALRYFAVTRRHWAQSPAEIRLLDQDQLRKLVPLIPGVPRKSSAAAGEHGDNSRSAAAFRLAQQLIRASASFEEMCDALRTDPATAEWCREKGDARQLKRLWDRAGAAGADDAPAFSDEAIALQLTAEQGDDARYVAVWNRWLLWNDGHWVFDNTMQMWNRARDLCRRVSKGTQNKKLAADVASHKKVAAVISLARADRQHAAMTSQWDTDLWLLKSAGPVIDLQTGDARDAEREDYCTKAAAVAPSFAYCPLWRAFLERITAGDAELKLYLQRIAGYCLTGIASEHVLFFFFGSGSNGKSVFINTLVGIWGDYATVSPMETFTATHTDRHPTDLAGLRGARLVVANETEADRQFAESRIKALTGGDKVAARFMRQDFFEYTPQFKLVIVGNHKPALSSVDEAIRRRIHLVPFTVTIPEAERDLGLPDKLKAEWPSILQWAIDGCTEWQRIGLAPPQGVLDATAEYFTEEDALARWIDECCRTGREQWGIGGKLWQSWKAWAERNNERVGTRKGFGQAMNNRGHKSDASQGVRGYAGIDLQPSQRQPEDEYWR